VSTQEDFQEMTAAMKRSIPPTREKEEEPAKRQAEPQGTDTDQVASVREVGVVRQGGDAVINNKRDLPAVESRMLRDRKKLHPPSRYEMNIAEFNTPAAFEEAIDRPDASRWLKAIEEELKAHEVNNT